MLGKKPQFTMRSIKKISEAEEKGNRKKIVSETMQDYDLAGRLKSTKKLLLKTH